MSDDSPNPKCAVIILAAGKGTRMRSDLPKVLHRIAGEPMIAHVARAASALAPARAVLVVAPGMERVAEAAKPFLPSVAIAIQNEQKGTGHAVACGMEALRDFKGDVLVVYGDTPLLQPETLANLLDEKTAHEAKIALLGMEPEDPTGYGRLVMPRPPFVSHIVECKDASAEEKEIGWVWGGVMAFDAAFLRDGLKQLQPSPVTGEYYLTALLEMATAKKLKSLMVPMDEEEAMGVNSRLQLAQAEWALQRRIGNRLMEEGVTLLDPGSIYFSADTTLGRDCVVHGHVVFGKGVSIGKNVEIRAFSHLEGVTVGDGAIIGPFARLRPGTVLEENVHIGNFVELKATHAKAGSKINHLAYVGDAEVGEAANVGAGTITCNYDGFAKHRTVIGAGAFIGSNSSLVAPVSIGAGAIVGAGSVITEDVPEGALAVERSAQTVKPEGAKRIRERKKV